MIFNRNGSDRPVGGYALGKADGLRGNTGRYSDPGYQRGYAEGRRAWDGTPVWTTRESDLYHLNPDCPGLKRVTYGIVSESTRGTMPSRGYIRSARPRRCCKLCEKAQ